MPRLSTLDLARAGRKAGAEKNRFEGSQSPLRKGMKELDQLKKESDAQAIARRDEKIRQLENQLKEFVEMISKLNHHNSQLQSTVRTLQTEIQELKTNRSTLSLMAKQLENEKKNTAGSTTTGDKPKPFSSRNPNIQTTIASIKKQAEKNKGPGIFSKAAVTRSKTPTLNRPAWK